MGRGVYKAEQQVAKEKKGVVEAIKIEPKSEPTELDARVEAAEVAAYNAANNVSRKKMEIEDLQKAYEKEAKRLEAELKQLEAEYQAAEKKVKAEQEARRIASKRLSEKEVAVIEAKVSVDTDREIVWGHFPTVAGKKYGRKVYFDERDARQASKEGTYDSARFWVEPDGVIGRMLTPEEMEKYI